MGVGVVGAGVGVLRVVGVVGVVGAILILLLFFFVFFVFFWGDSLADADVLAVDDARAGEDTAWEDTAWKHPWKTTRPGLYVRRRRRPSVRTSAPPFHWKVMAKAAMDAPIRRR